MSERIDEVGTFPVTLGLPFWEQMEAKGTDDLRMALVIPCQTDDGREEYFRAYFTGQIVQGGRNAGKPMYQVSEELCLNLGMEAPFDPTRTGELEDQKGELVMKEDEYKGVVRVKPAFLNPVYREKLTNEKAADIWAKLRGDKPRTQPAAPPQNARIGGDDLIDSEDDIPF